MKHLLRAAAAGAALSASASTNEIIVTATRIESAVETIPGNPSVITAEEIRQGQYTSVPQALRERAGLHIRNFSDNPNRATVDIRGFGENSHGRVLVLVNGRRVNRPDLAPLNWAQVPMASIKRIEVVRGAHTALYGDYAVGGVINIMTRRGSDVPRTSVGLEVGSHGFNDESLATSGRLGPLGYSASVGHQSSDGYRNRSGYETWSGNLGFEADPFDMLSAWFDYAYIDSDYELPGGLSEAQLNQDRRQAGNPDDDVREIFHNTTAGFTLYPNDRHEASLEAGFSRKDIESNIASFFSFNTWTIDTFTLSPKYVFYSEPFNRENQLTAGIDLGYDLVDVTLYGDRARTIRNGTSDVEKQTAGFYLHDVLNLRDNLLLTTGARAGRAEYSIEERDGTGTVQQDTSHTHDVEAYNAGLIWLPTDETKLFARFDRLYRLPFLDEQIAYQGFGSGFNKELDPETGHSYELGFALSPTTNLNLECTLFHIDMEGEIAYAVTNFATFEGANFNMDDTRHQGIELAGDWQPCRFLGLYANYTFQNVEFTSGANDGNEVPLVPKNLFSAGLDLELIEPLHFLADITYTDEQFAGSAVDNSAGTELEAYTLVDVALRYSRPVGKLDCTLFAGVDNLFDEKYSPMAFGGFGTVFAYYPAPERTYKAGLNITF